MKKIVVIGSSGAGKSTFSRGLGATTGIDVIHLDRLFWKPNWTETPRDEWKEILRETLKGDSWILDGNFGGTREMSMEASDTIIFLDIPRIVCVWRVLKRVAFYKKGDRQDMADGCDERFDWKFLIWIWNYPKISKPVVENLLEKFRSKKKDFCIEIERGDRKFPARY